MTLAQMTELKQRIWPGHTGAEWVSRDAKDVQTSRRRDTGDFLDKMEWLREMKKAQAAALDLAAWAHRFLAHVMSGESRYSPAPTHLDATERP